MKKLKPTAVTPANIMARKNLKPARPVKKQLLEVKQIFDWTQMQKSEVNGLYQKRQPIRALEGYLDEAPVDVFHGAEFSCGLSRIRNELRKILVLGHDDQEVRQTFFVNDIVNYTKVLANQSGAKHFSIRVNAPLPQNPVEIATNLALIVTYRGVELSLKQSMDGEIKTISPYGAVMIKGAAFDQNDKALLQWTGHSTRKDAFYLIIETKAQGRFN